MHVNVVDRLLGFLPKGMGGTTEPSLTLTLCGEDVVLSFAEDHFLELQVMVRESMTASEVK